MLLSCSSRPCHNSAYIEDKEQRPIVDVVRPKPPMKHIFPFRMALWTPSRGWYDVYTARPWAMGSEFVSKCTYGVNNYVFGAGNGLPRFKTPQAPACLAAAQTAGGAGARPSQRSTAKLAPGVLSSLVT